MGRALSQKGISLKTSYKLNYSKELPLSMPFFRARLTATLYSLFVLCNLILLSIQIQAPMTDICRSTFWLLRLGTVFQFAACLLASLGNVYSAGTAYTSCHLCI